MPIAYRHDISRMEYWYLKVLWCSDAILRPVPRNAQASVLAAYFFQIKCTTKLQGMATLEDLYNLKKQTNKLPYNSLQTSKIR